LHELGVIIEVVKRIETIAIQNQLTKIDKLVLQIGELSSMIPHYIESCYPAAVDGTVLEETKLEIEILPGKIKCIACENTFGVKEYQKCCPDCGDARWELLSGKEFLIKEIIAY
jgi:hydrogenase nickel incorporation protein HypA/HybF